MTLVQCQKEKKKKTFFFFAFVLCLSNSAANTEIELQSLIAKKMGKCLVIIMKIKFYRKKKAIVSRKTSNFAIKASWIDDKKAF